MARILLFIVAAFVLLGFFIGTLKFLLKFAIIAGVIYLIVKAIDKKKIKD